MERTHAENQTFFIGPPLPLGNPTRHLPPGAATRHPHR